MAETIVERLKRQLDAEEQVKELLPMDSDFYVRISEYSQQLRRSSGAGVSDLAVRMMARQTEMIQSMSKELLELRTRKAFAQNSLARLLPEERYICEAQQKFRRRFDDFVGALASGQPAFVEKAHRNETMRNITVRFTKHVDELVGLDLRHYGPFETEDLASIPSANADVLIASEDAVEVYTKDES